MICCCRGMTDQQVRDYMVARYGEFILFRPPMSWRNAWLWGAPPVADAHRRCWSPGACARATRAG